MRTSAVMREGLNPSHHRHASGSDDPFRLPRGATLGGLNGSKDDIQATWALDEGIGREVARVYQTLTP